jgi:DNA-binding NtrC family response regulator
MGNRSGKSTILFVDDNQTVLSVGTSIIQRCGYKILQAKNGTEAIQVFQNYIDEICMIILDEKLPDEPGSATCKRLKEHDPNVKVLHTSGLGRAQGNESLNCGCNDFLEKPFRVEELSNKLKEMLENT